MAKRGALQPWATEFLTSPVIGIQLAQSTKFTNPLLSELGHQLGMKKDTGAGFSQILQRYGVILEDKQQPPVKERYLIFNGVPISVVESCL